MRALNIVWLYNILKSKKTLVLIAIFITFSVFSIFTYKNQQKIENLKADLLKTQENLPSAEEKILIEYKNKIIDANSKIKSAEIKKAESERIIEKYSNFKECFEAQIDRVVNWQESLLEYCESKFENKSFSWSQANLIPKGGDKVSPSFDIDKFARAVAQHETWNCSKWTGIKYNNCFGIKNWSIAPCEKISSSWFCIYENTQDSFEAFKKIRSTAYGELPTLAMAERWTWNDRAEIWRKNVLNFYNS